MKPVEVCGLSYTIAGQRILEDVSFVIDQDEFVGLIGPNGGGKTTLLRILLGLERGWRGDVRVFGNPSAALGNVHRLVAYIPQGSTSTVGFPATARDVVLMGRVPGRGLFRRLSTRDRKVAAATLDEVGMADLAERPISELSGGQRQRVLIARALAAQSRLLLLDEPTTGVDQAAQASFFKLLAKLKQQFGLSIVMASHDLTAVSEHCTAIACLNRRMYCHKGPDKLDHKTLSDLLGTHLELFIHGDIPHRLVPQHDVSQADLSYAAQPAVQHR